jgi:hypothetical protein
MILLSSITSDNPSIIPLLFFTSFKSTFFDNADILGNLLTDSSEFAIDLDT